MSITGGSSCKANMESIFMLISLNKIFLPNSSEPGDYHFDFGNLLELQENQAGSEAVYILHSYADGRVPMGEIKKF